MRVWLELETNKTITGTTWPQWMIKVGEQDNWKGFLLRWWCHPPDYEMTLEKLLSSWYMEKRLLKAMQEWAYFEWEASRRKEA